MTTQTLAGGVRCFACKERGFFVTTPSGADYSTCPLCDEGAHYLDIAQERFDAFRDDAVFARLFGSDDVYCVDFCQRCGILYSYDYCVHSEWGCTDSVQYAAFIHKYTVDGVVQEGMPRFPDFEAMMAALPRLQVLQMRCTCEGGWNDCAHPQSGPGFSKPTAKTGIQHIITLRPPAERKNTGTDEHQ